MPSQILTISILASYRSQITCISLAKLERRLKGPPCQAVSHAAAAPPTCYETPRRDAAIVKLALIVNATNILPCRVYRNLVWTLLLVRIRVLHSTLGIIQLPCSPTATAASKNPPCLIIRLDIRRN